MNNKDKLQKNFDKYRELVGKADEIRQSIDIQHELFGFCAHMHHDNPSFSCWDRDLGSTDAVEFEVKDGNVLAIKEGRYEIETIQFMQGIIEDWLKQ